MPRLRRLSGREVIAILEDFGFVVIKTRGSHHKLRRIVAGQKQVLLVSVHGNKPLPPGTLRSIYREACNYISEGKLRSRFFTE